MRRKTLLKTSPQSKKRGPDINRERETDCKLILEVQLQRLQGLRKMFLFSCNEIFINKFLKCSSSKGFYNAAGHFITQFFSYLSATKQCSEIKHGIITEIWGCNLPLLLKFPRVSCAVFILIWSFEDFFKVSRCSIQFQIIQNNCAYVLWRRKNLKCAIFRKMLDILWLSWRFLVQKILWTNNYHLLYSFDGGFLIFDQYCKRL